MLRSFFTPILIAVASLTSVAQPYSSTLYNVAPHFTFTKSILTAGNGYVLAGNCSDSTGNYHRVMIMQTDSAGNLLWVKAYGEDSANYWDGFRALDQFSNGNIVLAGAYETSSGVAYQLYCFDQNGDTIWMYRNQPTGIDYLHQGRVNANDEVVTIGYTNTTVHNSICVFDSSGQLLHDTTIAPGDLYLYSIAVLHSGDYVFGGKFEPPAFDWFSITRTTDSSFTIIDSYSDPGSVLQDGPFNVSATSDSGYIACTWMVDSVSLPNYIAITYVPVIVKFDKNGNLQWREVIGPPCSDASLAQVKQLSDGNYYAVGYFNGDDYYYWPMVLKLDPSGNVIWKRKNVPILTTDVAFFPLDFVETPNHGLAIAGYTYSFSVTDTIGNRGWLLLLDSSGCGQPSRPYGLTATGAPSSFGAGLQITWSDTTGYSNRYMVERSCQNPPEQWSIINASSMPSLASYTDTGLIIGAMYCYCITALDDSGRMGCTSDTLCVVAVGTEEIVPSEPTVDIFPVPAKNELHFRINVPDEQQLLSLVVYNTIGQQIFNTRLSNGQTGGREELVIDTRQWPDGIYSFALTSEQSLLYSEKFIVIH